MLAAPVLEAMYVKESTDRRGILGGPWIEDGFGLVLTEHYALGKPISLTSAFCMVSAAEVQEIEDMATLQEQLWPLKRCICLNNLTCGPAP